MSAMDELHKQCASEKEEAALIAKVKEAQARIAAAKRRRIIVIGSAVAVGIVVLCVTVILPSSHYNKGVQLFASEDYTEAASEFRAAGRYKDAATRADDADRKRILETSIVNADNPSYGTDGGEDTSDKVFLLSIDEAYLYFSDDVNRIAYNQDGEAGWRSIYLQRSHPFHPRAR